MLEEFSRKLRQRCLQLGSIAAVCRGTGINRQQFNKYLAGRMLPGSVNMRKICRYIGVTEAQLMSGEIVDQSPPNFANPTEIDLAALPDLVPGQSRDNGGLRSLSQAGQVLPNGFYDCYTPSHSSPGEVIRWLLHIKPGTRGQVYTARTHDRDMKGTGHEVPRLRYRGIVFYGARAACLIGMSPEQAHHSSIMSIKTVPVTGRDYYSALALAHRANGPFALISALKFRGPEAPVRRVLAALGPVSLDEAGLDPVIVRMMRATPAAGSNWMQSVDEICLQTMSGGSGLPEVFAMESLTF